VTTPMTAPAARPMTGARQRLHPLTPVLRGAKFLAVMIAAASWRAYAELGPFGWTVAAAVVLVIGVAMAAVSWAVTGYEVVGRELRISEGLLLRRTRAIPLERVQAVDVVRPVLARLAGLAELRLEVVGAGKTEAPLAYLAVGDAVRLRQRLLALARSESGPATLVPGADAPAADAPPERLIHAVNNRNVVVGQLLTPNAWLLPVALVLTLLPYAEHPRVSFIAVASMLTAVVGVILAPLRRVLAEWDFRIGADEHGLRLHHGLLDTRSQTVPPQRVQAIALTWPLMWRPAGWLHARMEVAGYGSHRDRRGITTGTLLPVTDPPTARRVVAEVLAGVDVAVLPMRTAPVRARWLAPLAQPTLGVGVTGTVVATRDGWLRPQLVIVPLARIQSVRVVQGPLERALGLATVHVDTAGALHAVARLRAVADAYELAGVLAVAARAARSAESARAPGAAAAASPGDGITGAGDGITGAGGGLTGGGPDQGR
jgi:putative membrane protein